MISEYPLAGVGAISIPPLAGAQVHGRTIAALGSPLTPKTGSSDRPTPRPVQGGQPLCFDGLARGCGVQDGHYAPQTVCAGGAPGLIEWPQTSEAG
jgi:hypothetical protein